MTRRKCWGQPVIYSCAEAEFRDDPCGCMRTRFALDDRLNNDFVDEAGEVDLEGLFTPEGLAARPFPFRVATHSDYGLGPPAGSEYTPYWNSCQGWDGCDAAGERSVCLSEEQMIRWLLGGTRP